jgi:hypothetical protein
MAATWAGLVAPSKVHSDIGLWVGVLDTNFDEERAEQGEPFFFHFK